MINGHKIKKSFGKEKRVEVLHEVDICIQAGEFVAIMGPSGSGKSTLLYAISGLDTIDAGTVSFHDQELTSLNEQQLADLRRTNMGFIFQQPIFLKNLSIIDNIILPSLKERKDLQALEQQARSLMKRVGIAGLEDRKITQVSGGQLQRAGICRALMSNPACLFGDEPTGALNSKAAQEIMDLLLKINSEGTTMVLVTHDVKVAAQSERVLLMEDGQIVAELHLGSFTGNDLEKRMEAINERMFAVA